MYWVFYNLGLFRLVAASTLKLTDRGFTGIFRAEFVYSLSGHHFAT